MRTKYLLIIGMIISFLLSACSEQNSFPQLTHIPCKVSDSDLWGMVGVDGEILFENEFEEMPDIAVNGVFSIINSDNQIEYFIADKKPKQIGQTSYLDGGYYTEGLIPVTDLNHQISFIKKDGSTAFKLDKIKGKKVVCVAPFFSDGLMAVCTENNKWGYINTKGEVVIEPIYSFANEFNEGYAVVAIGYDAELKPIIIDEKGQEVIQLPNSDNDFIMEKFVSDKCINWKHNVFNIGKGSLFSNPNIFVFNYQNGYAPFGEIHNDENVYTVNKFGIIDRNGNIIVRAKYDGISRIINNHFFAKQQNANGIFNVDCLDNSGNKIFSIRNINDFYPFSENLILIQKDDKTYCFVDEKGEQSNKTTFFYVSLPAPFSKNYSLSALNPFLSYTLPRVYPHYYVQTDNPLW